MELNNGNILVSSFVNKSLFLYDSDFKFIKNVHCAIPPSGIACDREGNIYVSVRHSLKKFDSELNEIGHVNMFNGHAYSDIFIDNNRIYACKENVKQLAIFTLDFNLIIESLRLTCTPVQIKIANNTACLLGKVTGTFKMYFYKILSNSRFQFIIKHDAWGPPLAYQNMFYVYENTGFSVFNDKGEFVERQKKKFGSISETFNTKHQNNTKTHNNSFKSGIGLAKNKLLICLQDAKQLCKVPVYGGRDN